MTMPYIVIIAYLCRFLLLHPLILSSTKQKKSTHTHILHFTRNIAFVWTLFRFTLFFISLRFFVLNFKRYSNQCHWSAQYKRSAVSYRLQEFMLHLISKKTLLLRFSMWRNTLTSNPKIFWYILSYSYFQIDAKCQTVLLQTTPCK